MWIAASFSMIPDCTDWLRALRWRFTRFTRSTITRFFSGRTASTRLTVPASSPESTTTLSFFKSFMGSSDHFRSEGDDLHEFLLAQLAGHRPEDASAPRLPRVVD